MVCNIVCLEYIDSTTVPVYLSQHCVYFFQQTILFGTTVPITCFFNVFNVDI